jgi:hypothetical protein
VTALWLDVILLERLPVGSEIIGGEIVGVLLVVVKRGSEKLCSRGVNFTVVRRSQG